MNRILGNIHIIQNAPELKQNMYIISELLLEL